MQIELSTLKSEFPAAHQRLTIQYGGVKWRAMHFISELIGITRQHFCRGAVVHAGTLLEVLPIEIVTHPWREHVALKVAQFVEATFGGWQKPNL